MRLGAKLIGSVVLALACMFASGSVILLCNIANDFAVIGGTVLVILIWMIGLTVLYKLWAPEIVSRYKSAKRIWEDQ